MEMQLLDSIAERDGCLVGLAVPHQSLALRITHGLISIAAGAAAGGALGLVCAATPIWSSPFRRAGALLVMAELMAFCGYAMPCGAVLCVDVLCFAVLCLLCPAVPCGVTVYCTAHVIISCCAT